MEKSFAMAFITVQMAIPNKVGKRKDTTVHFKLLLSFFIVISVVEHGQCIRENMIAQRAVICVQPDEVRIVRTDEKL